MTDFANPLVIGKDFPVLAGILYDEMVGFQNTELAAAIAVWIIVPAISIYFLLERIGRRKRFDTGDSSGGPPELPVPRPVKIGLTHRQPHGHRFDPVALRYGDRRLLRPFVGS